MANTLAGGGPRSRAPWHFWAIAALSLAWNGFGAYDYLMSLTRGADYMREMGMTDAQIATYEAMPAWTLLPWTLGVWGALAGSALLLLRSRYAVHAFAISLTGLIVSLIYAYLLSDAASAMGRTGQIMNAVILAGCLFFLAYAGAAVRRGILR